MHEWRNPRFYNVVVWIAVVVLIGMTVVLVGSSVREMFFTAT
jgi:Mn2+/Fe2+ NRAMP family transporter